ncbi:MAG: type III secretion system inner rod subunit SctI [Burkholderiales bacterium]
MIPVANIFAASPALTQNLTNSSLEQTSVAEINPEHFATPGLTDMVKQFANSLHNDQVTLMEQAKQAPSYSMIDLLKMQRNVEEISVTSQLASKVAGSLSKTVDTLVSRIQ